MAIPIYLAMTSTEISFCDALPPHPAWMACHFSCYGAGLSNFPKSIPEGAMLILNDRTPPSGHNPALIAEQLSQLVDIWKLSCVLLDFQRPGLAENTAIAKAVVEKLVCPVGISDTYANVSDCAVFLSPPPLHRPLAEHLNIWQRRELWLDISMQAQTISVTEQGSQICATEKAPIKEPSFFNRELCCHYHIDITPEEILFTLTRTKEDLNALLETAESCGITRAVGLYQELYAH